MTTNAKQLDSHPGNAMRSALRPRSLLVLVILALPLLVLWGFGEDESPETMVNAQSAQSVSYSAEQSDEPTASANASSDPAPASDETYRQLIVGTWETDRDGRRFLKVSDDGTAVMNVEIDSKWSLLFGKKMTFNIVWTIEDGVLTFETTGGEPKTKVDLITRMYGKQRVQKIKILDKTTLRLPDEDPESEDHVWTRVESADTVER